MKIPCLSAGLALCWSLSGAPAFAQQSGDCDMLCRVSHYLASDHMTGEAAPAAPSPAAAKPRHPRAAAVHRKPAPPPSASPSATAPTKVATTKVAAKAEPKAELGAEASTRPVVAAVRVAPARAASPVAAPRQVRLAVAPPPEPVHAASETRVAPAPARRRDPARGRPGPPTAATHTASLSSVIPGSAPAMQAGFH